MDDDDEVVVDISDEDMATLMHIEEKLSSNPSDYDGHLAVCHRLSRRLDVATGATLDSRMVRSTSSFSRRRNCASA